MYIPVDFAIVCALEEEKKAICNILNSNKWNSKKDGSLTYFSTYQHEKHIRLVSLGDENQGILNASIVATEVLLSWSPRCIISFGLAGRATCDDEDISLCDVVIGNQIIYYEPGKETDDEKDTNKIGYLSFNNRTINADNNKFTDIIEKIKEAHTEFRVKDGNIFSGEKKIASQNGPIRQLLKTSSRKTLAIEMEAAGVGGANERYSINNPCLFLSIKGISDDAGREESGENRAPERIEVREKAARNCAIVTDQIIKESDLIRYELGGTRNKLIRKLWQSSSDLAQIINKYLDPEETFKQCCERPANHYGATQIGLQYQLLSLSCRSGNISPPVYVHWKVELKWNLINWIDIYHLMVLKKISNLGHPIHILLTDRSLPKETPIRSKIEKIINAILGNNVIISWYSKEIIYKNVYESYTETQIEVLGYREFCDGYHGEFHNVFENSPFFLNVKEFNKSQGKPEVFWAKYIIWSTQKAKNFMVFALKGNLHIWTTLIGLYSRDALLLVRKSLSLDEYHSKAEGPGKDMCFNPPEHSQLVSHLRTINNIKILEDFLSYFEEVITFDIKVASNDSELRLEYDYYEKQNQDDPLVRLKIRVLDLLSYMNQKIFTEFTYL